MKISISAVNSVKRYPVLASWFSSQDNFWIFDISCQDLGNYSWQSSQDFARFFKIMETNPRKILDFLARKARIFKILARKPRKFWIKVIQDLLMSYKQLSLKTQKGLLLRVHLSEPQLGLTKKIEAKLN